MWRGGRRLPVGTVASVYFYVNKGTRYHTTLSLVAAACCTNKQQQWWWWHLSWHFDCEFVRAPSFPFLFRPPIFTLSRCYLPIQVANEAILVILERQSVIVHFWLQWRGEIRPSIIVGQISPTKNSARSGNDEPMRIRDSWSSSREFCDRPREFCEIAFLIVLGNFVIVLGNFVISLSWSS